MLTKQEKANLKELSDAICAAQADCIKRGGIPSKAPIKVDNRTIAIMFKKKKGN